MDGKLEQLVGALRETKRDNTILRTQVKKQWIQIRNLEIEIRWNNLVVKSIRDAERERERAEWK